ncbi:MAG TPA: hypothetical protein VFV66_05675 [Nonomuraea sp.]|nr:hypothetical protein [Nonomuraea sp.]
MSDTPAPVPRQERKTPRKKIAVRRLGKSEITGWAQPSQGTSN